MAVTAAVNLRRSTTVAGVPVDADVTVTNGDATPVMVTNISIFPADSRFPLQTTLSLIPTAGGGAGPSPDLPQGTLGTVTLDTNNTYEPCGPTPVGTVWVADSSGTLMFPFQAVSFHPQGINKSATIDIEATVELSDGTLVAATAATLTINSPQSVAYDP